MRGEDDVDLEAVSDFDVPFGRAGEAVDDEGEDVVEGQVLRVRAARWWELVFEIDLGGGE